MREVKQYQCEICRRIHHTKEEAELCEKHHVLPISVSTVSGYKASMDDHPGFSGVPKEVVVEMSDGEKYIYECSRRAW